MHERVFVFVSGVCDIKGLTLLVSHQVWFVHMSPQKAEGGEQEKNTPINKASSGTRRVNCGGLSRASKPATEQVHVGIRCVFIRI